MEAAASRFAGILKQATRAAGGIKLREQQLKKREMGRWRG